MIARMSVNQILFKLTRKVRAYLCRILRNTLCSTAFYETPHARLYITQIYCTVTNLTHTVQEICNVINSYSFMIVNVPIFTQLEAVRQPYVKKSYTEFHGNMILGHRQKTYFSSIQNILSST
jgi:hypothetical protein